MFESQSGKTAASLTRLSQVATKARPVSLASEQVLELLPAFESILPNGLQRGTTSLVEGNGATSLALALAAGASQAGSWVSVIGMPSLGVGAAAELGVCIDRLLMVAAPAKELWPTVAAAMLDAFDVVMMDWPGAPASIARRLAARARERKSVLLAVATSAAWREAADLRFQVSSRWEGLEQGHGRLTARLMQVELGGRRSVRPQRLALWLPDSNGRIAEVTGEIGAVEQPPLRIAGSAGALSRGFPDPPVVEEPRVIAG